MRFSFAPIARALALATCLACASTASAQQNWYDTILPEKTHDFGTVARGSKVRHSFPIVNTTDQEVHIADYRTKCGCTEVKLGARNIPPGTQTTIELTLDTTRFSGHKASGITLIFDKPQFVQTDLNLTSFIRADVMMNPGSVDFQTVPRGDSTSQSLTLTYYGPKADWAITRLTTISEHITAELREVSRNPGSSVQYQLTTKLNATAPAGNFRDEVNLLTNDEASPSIPISVTAVVQPALTISPAILNLGRMRPGQSVQKTVLVRGSKSFKLTGATCPKPDLTAAAALGETKPFHPVTITFKAPTTPGPYNATLEITTDLADEPPATITAFAQVIP